MTITLQSNGWDLELSPENGAALTYCRFEGQDILRPYSGNTGDDFEVLSSGGFCLVPFSNRIEDGTFTYDGRTVSLGLTHDKIPPHPIHGFGWISAWTATDKTNSSVTLTHDHPAGEWPWAYRAHQHISADGPVLTHDLSVTNISDSVMPAGLGFHPYFPDAANAKLKFSAGGLWQNRADGIPVRHVRVPSNWDFSDGSDVAGTNVDNVYTNADPVAEIRWKNAPIALKIESCSKLAFAVIYTGGGDGSFCFEPVTQITDAVNRQNEAEPTGLIDLAPGETARARMTYTII